MVANLFLANNMKHNDFFDIPITQSQRYDSAQRRRSQSAKTRAVLLRIVCALLADKKLRWVVILAATLLVLVVAAIILLVAAAINQIGGSADAAQAAQDMIRGFD